MEISNLTAGSGFNNSILAGLGTLIRTMIQSPNYVPGVSGWTINKDGSAEFNNLTIRGIFDGNNFVINTSGAFFYSGVPALGNLAESVTNAAGTDSFGNAYLEGVSSYMLIGGIYFAVNMSRNQLSFYKATVPGGPYTVGGDMRLSGNALVIDAQVGFLQLPASTAPGPALPNMAAGTQWAVDNWVTSTLANGWFKGTGFLFYRKTVENELQITFDITAPAAAVNGVTIFTFPGAYSPVSTHQFPIAVTAQNSGTANPAHMFVNSAGVMQSSGVAANAECWAEVKIPLDI